MDALTIMFYGNKTLMDALNAVDTVDWDRPNVCGVWSVKDIVSHLAASELLTSDIFGLFTGAAEKPMFDRMAAAYATWNDDTVAERRGLNAEQALAEYKTAYLEKMARAEVIGPELLAKSGTIPWYGESYSLDDYIVYGDYGHKREHAAQINVFRDLLKSGK
ncbi:MAG: maleylpyruvate isomerase N-terminal domain-containing protein [Anaerolineae bacterium]|nr:maleylpyruvate isomerase N-terminal domain-containing protein [Chloroflexota bacterium]MBP6298682.1 maleylpyruvate isomerase N-terminal domain-containing protein [Anaerolineae bacterium]